MTDGPERSLVLMRRVGVLALTVEVAVLLVTGILLSFFYRPEASPWTDVYAAHRSVTFSTVIAYGHRWTVWAAVLTSLTTAILLVAEAALRWNGPSRRRTGAATGPVILVAVIASFVTGSLLPWDQLALWAVTVGGDVRGYRPLFGDQVRFVLVKGSEVDPGTIVAWLLVHVALTVPVVAALWASRNRRRPSAPEIPPHGIELGGTTGAGARVLPPSSPCTMTGCPPPI